MRTLMEDILRTCQAHGVTDPERLAGSLGRVIQKKTGYHPDQLRDFVATKPPEKEYVGKLDLGKRKEWAR